MAKQVGSQLAVRKITTIPVDQQGGVNTAIEMAPDPFVKVKNNQKHDVDMVGGPTFVFDTSGVEPGFTVGSKLRIDFTGL